MVEKLESPDAVLNQPDINETAEANHFCENWNRGFSSMEIPKFVVRLLEAEEKAPCISVQAEQIREAFLNTPDAAYENWKYLTAEQRLIVLFELEREAASISLRDPLPVTAQELAVPGLCKGNQIIISEQLLQDSSQEGYWKTMEALFHEGRHAYQAYNMYVSQVEQSVELVNAWRLNMNLGYDNGAKPKYFGRSEEQLELQAREVDADAFTMEVMKRLNLNG